MDTLPVGVSGASVIGLLLFTIVSMLYGLYRSLSSGGLCTGRELREKNVRIEALEAALKTRDHQLSLVLSEAMTTLSPVLRAMRAAIDAETDEVDTT